ncbi:hypothetical protein EPUS_07673 [Endocarpon pusillum Z07020]|uniref:Small ribosomal subunit protein mS29 n=1 Tax=Endocarpon pusillum (strain Z07020 / HMAS-L-300199) TaxID=1263415 RepID=U1GHJ3_ENDPU|nr:uncharacterized protein EPUS_07673 [Endocarpon pusillum Z07020]ERF77132.1 hypothetical protein EPUS_07673 [Endocarpon pusillum Z07020]
MIGERKALRKRIVISNTNALEVQGLRDLNVKNMVDETQIGQMLALNEELLDHLRDVRAFKPTQNWNMFRKPSTLMRRESVEMGRTILDVSAGQAEERPRTVRRIIAGERGTGKSLMLLQAMSMAFLNDWVVINVPEGQEYTIAHSAYAPMTINSARQLSPDQAAQTASKQSQGSQEMIYNQPTLTAELLQRISKSNENVLKRIPLAHEYKFGDYEPKNLYSLAVVGVEETSLSWKVWQTLWEELTSPSERRRPPVLVAIDGIDHWMTLSKYRSADYKPIHAHQLAPIRHFVEMLFNQNGAGQLANGGIVLAATTGSNAPSVPAFELLLKQLDARARGLKMGDNEFPMPQPYKTVDQRVLNLLEGSAELNVQRLKGLEKDVEAKGLLEYFARSGVFREVVSERTVAEKWSLAGGGVIGELARFGSRLRV